ncbi:MAG: hypothetical protein ACOYMF_13915 [Bacteroidales bacterium]
MNLSTTSQKRILLLWAFAICWFYLGSLINFHQHHIWGKILIPQINSCSRNKSKIFHANDIDEAAGFNLPVNDVVFTAQTSVGYSLFEPTFVINTLNSIPPHPFVPTGEGFAFSQLRGPPQA